MAIVIESSTPPAAAVWKDLPQGEELLEAMRGCVRRGAMLLDQRLPARWAQVIEANFYRLDMADQKVCVLGLLFGDYCKGLDLVDTAGNGGPYYGFDVPSYAEDFYPDLTQMWKDVVTNRLQANG